MVCCALRPCHLTPLSVCSSAFCRELGFCLCDCPVSLEEKAPVPRPALSQPSSGTGLHECASGCAHLEHPQDVLLHPEQFLCSVGRDRSDVTSKFVKALSSVLEAHTPLSQTLVMIKQYSLAPNLLSLSSWLLVSIEKAAHHSEHIDLALGSCILL